MKSEVVIAKGSVDELRCFYVLCFSTACTVSLAPAEFLLKEKIND